MPGQTDSSRVSWIVIHGSLLGCGLWLWILAEDQRNGNQRSPSFSEPSQGDADTAARSGELDKQTEIQKQIARLGDPISGVRARATRHLMAMGSPAVPPLAKALSSHDPEMRRQAQQILSRLIRSDEDCFAELEEVACTPEHPSSNAASGILQRECSRRVDVETAILEQRKANALRYLREAKEALFRGEFLKARQMVFAAESLDVTYQPVDEQPAFVLKAIERAERRATLPPRPTLVTAERE